MTASLEWRAFLVHSWCILGALSGAFWDAFLKGALSEKCTQNAAPSNQA